MPVSTITARAPPRVSLRGELTTASSTVPRAELSATPGKKMTAWGETQHFARQGDLLARIAMKAEQRAKSFGQLFRLFNGDGDGRLSAEEVRRGVGLLGWSLTDDELAGLMADFDTDGDGTVSQRELALAIERVIGRFK